MTKQTNTMLALIAAAFFGATCINAASGAPDETNVTLDIFGNANMDCIRQFEFDPLRQSDFDPLLSG